MSFFTFCGLLLREFWWLIIPFVLGKVFFDLRRAQQKKNKEQKEEVQDWVVLEIKVNKEILQTPKAMEQVLAGFHSIKKGSISLEVVGVRGVVHFIVRAPREYKTLVESQFYAQYPELEIKEIDDYFSVLPSHLPDKKFDLWGTEIELAREDAYPIRTYPYFEGPKEEKTIDTLASLIESTSSLQEGEEVILQITIKPLEKEAVAKQRKQGEQLIKVILGEEEAKPTFSDWVIAFFKNLLVAAVVIPTWPGEGEKKTTIALSTSFPGKDLVKEVEAKMAQLSFSTTIRALYLSPKKIYNESSIIPLLAYFKQFNTENLNAFQVNTEISTEVKAWLFRENKLRLKKSDFYQKARKRATSSASIVLDLEELATIYHIPVRKVKGPTLTRALSRKGEPPVGLPIG